jgi:hypothetical protein
MHANFLPSHCLPRLRALSRRLALERQRAGILGGLAVSLVSRGPILQGLASYARRAFLPLLQVSLRAMPMLRHGAGPPSAPCLETRALLPLAPPCRDVAWASSPRYEPLAVSYPAPIPRPPAPPLALQERGVEVHEVEGGVVKVEPGVLLLADGRALRFDHCLWSTQASAAGWLADTGLPVDAGACCAAPLSEAFAQCATAESRIMTWSLFRAPLYADGFLLVDDCLRSAGGPPNVFAAGDCASSVTAPRPKAGVFAVRAVRASAFCSAGPLGHPLQLAPRRGCVRPLCRGLRWQRTCAGF